MQEQEYEEQEQPVEHFDYAMNTDGRTALAPFTVPNIGTVQTDDIVYTADLQALLNNQMFANTPIRYSIGSSATVPHLLEWNKKFPTAKYLPMIVMYKGAKYLIPMDRTYLSEPITSREENIEHFRNKTNTIGRNANAPFSIPNVGSVMVGDIVYTADLQALLNNQMIANTPIRYSVGSSATVPTVFAWSKKFPPTKYIPMLVEHKGIKHLLPMDKSYLSEPINWLNASGEFKKIGAMVSAKAPVVAGTAQVAANKQVKPTQGANLVGTGKGATIGNLVGLGAGLYYAHKKKSGVGGYVGYGLLFAVGGWIVGGIGDKLLGKGKSGSSAGAGSSAVGSEDAKITASINAMFEKGVANIDSLVDEKGKAQATPQNIALAKSKLGTDLPKVLSQLNSKDKEIAIDGLAEADKMMDMLIANGKSGIKTDPMVIFGKFAEIQKNLMKKYSESEMKSFGDKIAKAMEGAMGAVKS